MSETKMAVASAVIVPEAEEQPLQPLDGAKRKTSSFSQDSSKRPRLNSETSYDRIDPSQSSTASDRASDRRRSGQLEERKRGQRLFGALLGTLSQSSSSTAQKRRTEIEKKQQTKLRVQAEEHDEQKKQRLETLMAVRRKEQKKYNKQSVRDGPFGDVLTASGSLLCKMHIRHSNMLAQAHFLQTAAEPKLYYKPWELLPSEESKIKSQIEAVEATIQQETARFDSESAHAATESKSVSKPPLTEPKSGPEQGTDHATETVGSESNIPQEAAVSANGGATDKKADPVPPEPEAASAKPQEILKDQEDDGGEMVEADEDM
ncbi:MAG: hypothetical protein Q9181_006236, partial [Wetmoreana brouardii]